MLRGGKGADYYVVTRESGPCTIENESDDFADVGGSDVLFVDAGASELSVVPQSGNNDLVIRAGAGLGWRSQVTLKEWFAHKRFRHLYVTTNDYFTVALNGTKACQRLRDACILPGLYFYFYSNLKG